MKQPSNLPRWLDRRTLVALIVGVGVVAATLVTTTAKHDTRSVTTVDYRSNLQQGGVVTATTNGTGNPAAPATAPGNPATPMVLDLAQVEQVAGVLVPQTNEGWEPDDGQVRLMVAACAALITGPLGPMNQVPGYGQLDGGRACQVFWNATLESLRIAWQTYVRDKPPHQRQYGGDDQRDAQRHCLWQGFMTERNWRHDPWIAEAIGDLHELDALKHVFAGHAEANTKMDLWNNAVSRRYAAWNDQATDTSVIAYCTRAAATAHLVTADHLTGMTMIDASNTTANYLVYFSTATY